MQECEFFGHFPPGKSAVTFWKKDGLPKYVCQDCRDEELVFLGIPIPVQSCNRGKCNFVIKLIMFENSDIDKLPSLSTSVGFMVAHFWSAYQSVAWGLKRHKIEKQRRGRSRKWWWPTGPALASLRGVDNSSTFHTPTILNVDNSPLSTPTIATNTICNMSVFI